jgi:antirestriction protein ArdC
MWASAFRVFNIDQQEGFEIEIPDLGDEPTRLKRVEEFIEATGADIRYVAQDSAHFDRNTDQITLPLREQFDDGRAFYGTALHELTHWTGPRLDRVNGKRFGDDAYAVEELIAELGATFLAAHFKVEVDPHIEHVNYLASWLKVLKNSPLKR